MILGTRFAKTCLISMIIGLHSTARVQGGSIYIYFMAAKMLNNKIGYKYFLNFFEKHKKFFYISNPTLSNLEPIRNKLWGFNLLDDELKISNFFISNTSYVGFVCKSDPRFEFAMRAISCATDDVRVFVMAEQPFCVASHGFTQRLPVSIRISDTCIRAIFINYRRLNDNLSVGISRIHGLGLFADICINKNTKLFRLDGDFLSLQTSLGFDFTCEWNAISKDLLLVRNITTSYGFINHSRNPNCFIDRSDMSVVSLCSIKAGDELFLDYREEPLPDSYVNMHGSTYL